jgi:dolichol-phosphate mannosyltransferase
VTITAIIARLFILQGWNIYLGQLVGILTATCWSFTANNRWTWSSAKPKAEEEQPSLVVTQETR